MTEQYEYCITFPRTFVHDCTFGKIIDLTKGFTPGCRNPSLRKHLITLRHSLASCSLPLMCSLNVLLTLLLRYFRYNVHMVYIMGCLLTKNH